MLPSTVQGGHVGTLAATGLSQDGGIPTDLCVFPHGFNFSTMNMHYLYSLKRYKAVTFGGTITFRKRSYKNWKFTAGHGGTL